jgi:hypothetical protein
LPASDNVFYGDLTVKNPEALPVALKKAQSAEQARVIALSRDPRWDLVQRVAASEAFRGSTRLRDFLLHVAECAIREAPEDATEQQIGVKVFQRSPGYNSSEDSIVRSHARLLRQKLGDYFSNEGISEPEVIEIPKGHYLPSFHPRETKVKSTKRTSIDGSLPQLEPSEPAEPSIRSTKYGIYGTIIALVLTVLALGAWFAFHPSRPHEPAPGRAALDTLWAPFLSGTPPLVIYSNALFLGDSKTGLRYPPPDTKPDQLDPDQTVANYTGIGEVASVYQLTKLFDAHDATFILKRSLLVTWDEAKLTNLIFIGSAAENPSLRVLHSTTDFTMMTGPDFAGVVNHHPKPGEPELYSRPEHPLTKDYAIVALVPGIEPGKRMLILSGLTTLGTQAAVEFACRPESVAELFKAGGMSKSQLRNFEAVLEVTLGGGVPLQTRLVTVRVH